MTSGLTYLADAIGAVGIIGERAAAVWKSTTRTHRFLFSTDQRTATHQMHQAARTTPTL